MAGLSPEETEQHNARRAARLASMSEHQAVELYRAYHRACRAAQTGLYTRSDADREVLQRRLDGARVAADEAARAPWAEDVE